MFVLTMLLIMAGMALLIFTLTFFAYKILRNQRNLYSWFTLTLIVFFLVVALWKSLRFLNVY